MAHEGKTPFERYLAQVGAELRVLGPQRREALLAELRAHLADAAELEGRDPGDPAFQQLVVGRLGPARRVGRELAAANEPATRRRARQVLGYGAVGALLIPWIIIGGLLIQMERLAELTVMTSQVVLLLVALALHQLTRPVAPRLSWAATLIGISGALTIPAAFLLSAFVQPPWDRTYVLAANLLIMACLWLTGVWAILSGGLLLLRNRLAFPGAPLRDPLLGPALLGWLWGAAWIVVASNLVVEARWAPFWLLNLATPAWLALHFGWCLWLGLALTRMARQGPPAAPVARW